MIQLLQNLKEISHKYDGFIVDIWGVIHDGINLFPAIFPLFEDLKNHNKQIVLLSNSPRRSYLAQEKLRAMNLPPHLYDKIHTAGEDCRRALSERTLPLFCDLGQRFYLIGRDYDRPLFEGLTYEEVNTVAAADFLLVTGTVDPFEDNLDTYKEILSLAFDRDLPLVCANADRHAPFGKRKVICAGMIAEQYEQLGGIVHYHGKPDPLFYKPAQDFLSLPNERILAIGDSLATDILGANLVGIDSLFVFGGMHHTHLTQEDAALTLGRLTVLTKNAKATPTYAIYQLQ